MQKTFALLSLDVTSYKKLKKLTAEATVSLESNKQTKEAEDPQSSLLNSPGSPRKSKDKKHKEPDLNLHLIGELVKFWTL